MSNTEKTNLTKTLKFNFSLNFKKVFPVSLGNTLENYDFCLSGILAPIFAKKFFPDNFKYSLIFAFFIFATAYLSRPIGLLIWGHIADKYGRKPVLIGTLSVMAIAAIGIAIVPTYQSIGIYAIVLVFAFRFLQGVAFGGEFPTTMVILYEIAPHNRKGLYCSLTSSASCLGLVIAIFGTILLIFVMGKQDFYNYGWRFLFGLSVVFIVVIGYLRTNISETLQPSNSTKLPILDAVKDWKIIVFGVLFYCLSNVLFFSYTYHVNTILQAKHQLTDVAMYSIQAVMMLYLIIVLPLMGLYADKTGRFKCAKYTFIMLFVLAIPAYQLLYSDAFYFLGIIVLGFFVATVVSLVMPITIEQVTKTCRVSAVGMVDSISTLLFGSTAPIISALLINSFNNQIAPSYYLMLITFISFSSLCIMKKIRNRKKSLWRV